MCQAERARVASPQSDPWHWVSAGFPGSGGRVTCVVAVWLHRGLLGARAWSPRVSPSAPRGLPELPCTFLL